MNVVGARSFYEPDVAGESTHPLIVEGIRRIKARNVVRACIVDQVTQEDLAQALMLPCVGDCDGDFGALDGVRSRIAADADLFARLAGSRVEAERDD